MEKVKTYVDKLVSKQVKALESKLNKIPAADAQSREQQVSEKLSTHELQLN